MTLEIKFLFFLASSSRSLHTAGFVFGHHSAGGGLIFGRLAVCKSLVKGHWCVSRDRPHVTNVTDLVPCDHIYDLIRLFLHFCQSYLTVGDLNFYSPEQSLATFET